MEGKMPEGEDITRRTFFGYAIGAMGAFIGAIVGIPIVGFVLSPALQKKTEGLWIKLGKTETLKRGEPTMVQFSLFKKDGWVETAQQKSVWVVAKEDGKFIVYNARCTHLGCLVNWDQSDKAFKSPCHGGIFTADGKVIGGPPPRPLDSLPIKIEDGMLECQYVDFRLGVPEKVQV